MANVKILITVLCVVLPVTLGTPVRLVGDTTNSTGRLELFDKGKWFMYDQRYISPETVKVVCRMLGFGDSGFAVHLKSDGTKGLFYYPSGEVILEDFRCTGNETDVSQCRSGAAPWSTGISTYYVPTAISCTGTQLRLIDGDTPSSGRVEVRIKGDWHTICDSSFGTEEARVVCSMLGFGNTGIAMPFGSSTFGQGFGDTAVSGLGCVGNEKDIKLCGGYWSSSCNHRNDAGVKCGGTPIRLVNGPDSSSGRVEIQHAGQWGTVCGDSNFDHRDVMVICRMLGYNTTEAFGHSSGYYGEGDGHVIAAYPACDGSEDDIAQCASVRWIQTSGSELCTHDRDIGVNCNGQTTLRLVDGFSEQSGRVEIFHNGHWGTVGSSSFDRHDLKVVCRMLGFEYTESSFYKDHNYFGVGSGKVVVNSLACLGNENDIGQCKGTWWPSTRSTSHSYDVGVSCDGVIPIRVVGGHNNATGRVELLHNGNFGTICDNGFDRSDLIVVCRMLGFHHIPPSAYWHPAAYYGEGLGEILASDLACNGDETTIGACGGTWPASSYCLHSKDVSVSCDGTSEMLRLVSGTNNYTGRVEVFHNGNWGRMCAYEFDRADAVVLCRLLNFKHPEAAVAYTRSRYGQGNGTVVLTRLQCNGLETALEQCKPQWLPGSCSTSYGDVGVDCCPSCSSGQIIG